MTRARADRVLYQADQIAGQVADILARSRAEIERRSPMSAMPQTGQQARAEDLRQPVRAQPVLQADHEDLRVQAVYDTALVFTKGAQELHDAVKTLETMAARTDDPQQQQEILQLQQTGPDPDESAEETSTAAGRGAQAGDQRSRTHASVMPGT